MATRPSIVPVLAVWAKAAGRKRNSAASRAHAGRRHDGLEHAEIGSDITGAAEADGACDLHGHVGDDVAIEVFSHDHVEIRGARGDAGGADIDDVEVLFDVRVFLADLIKDRAE